MDNSLKWCSRRGHWVAREAFNKHSHAKDGLQRWCRECARDYAADRNAADPTFVARGHAMFDTPALRAVVLAALPKLADGRPACMPCLVRPATRVEHRHMFAAASGEFVPGELRGYVCASCNITLSFYESRAHELSPEDPARDLALAGDVVAALRLTAEALENGTPCKPLVKRLNNKRTKGPFDCTAAGFRRAADYIEYSPVRRLMDSGDPAIWTAIADALNAGGNTAKLAAIHCAEAGYRDCAEAYGIDVDAAIRHFAARATAPAHAQRQYGQAAYAKRWLGGHRTGL